MSDPYQPGAAETTEAFEGKYSASAFCVKVRGDSMVAPDGSGFAEGTIIAVEPTIPANHGDFVIVRFPDSNEATFKQLVIDGPARYLRPLNPRYPTQPVPETAVLVGVVTESTFRKRYR